MQPSLMPGVRVGSRLLADGQAIVDVLPVVGCGIGWIDAERLDGVDRLQHLLDLRPPGNAQKSLPTGAHIRHRRVALAGRDRAQDVDARYDGSIVVRGPADEGDDAARHKRDDAPLTIDDVLLGDPTEADPVLDAVLDPHELDMREFAHAVPPGLSGNSRVSTSHSVPAPRIPRGDPLTFMPP